MYDEKWFKFLTWSSASFFFFLTACVLMAMFGPPPTEGQVHQWMAGMMKAMHQSLMGLSMDLEEDSQLAAIMARSSRLILPLGLGGLLGGLFFRYTRSKDGK